MAANRKRLHIPNEMLVLHHDLTIHEIRAAINVVLRSKKNRFRNAKIINIMIPSIGKSRSHGNARPKYHKKRKASDRRRKSKEYLLKTMTKENILY